MSWMDDLEDDGVGSQDDVINHETENVVNLVRDKGVCYYEVVEILVISKFRYTVEVPDL